MYADCLYRSAQPPTLYDELRIEYVISQLRFDYDTTTIRRYHDEKLTCSFLFVSNRVEWKQARAMYRIRIVYSRIAIVIVCPVL